MNRAAVKDSIQYRAYLPGTRYDLISYLNPCGCEETTIWGLEHWCQCLSRGDFAGSASPIQNRLSARQMHSDRLAIVAAGKGNQEHIVG